MNFDEITAAGFFKIFVMLALALWAIWKTLPPAWSAFNAWRKEKRESLAAHSTEAAALVAAEHNFELDLRRLTNEEFERALTGLRLENNHLRDTAQQFKDQRDEAQRALNDCERAAREKEKAQALKILQKSKLLRQMRRAVEDVEFFIKTEKPKDTSGAKCFEVLALIDEYEKLLE